MPIHYRRSHNCRFMTPLPRPRKNMFKQDYCFKHVHFKLFFYCKSNPNFVDRIKQRGEQQFGSAKSTHVPRTARRPEFHAKPFGDEGVHLVAGTVVRPKRAFALVVMADDLFFAGRLRRVARTRRYGWGLKAVRIREWLFRVNLYMMTRVKKTDLVKVVIVGAQRLLNCQ